MSDLSFSQSVLRCLPEGKLIQDNGREELQLPADSHNVFLKISSVPGLSFTSFEQLQGLNIAPVVVSYYQQAVREDVRHVLGKQVNIGANPQFLEATNNESVVNDEKSGRVGFLLTSHDGKDMDVEAIREYFVNEVVQSLGKHACLVTRNAEQSKPAYKFLRKNRETITVDNRNDFLRTPSLLTRELRSLLEKNGRIVFESNPHNTDRLIIAFPHHHGSGGDADRLCIMNSDFGKLFVDHQKGVTETGLEIIKQKGIENVHVLFETFPANIRNWPAAEQEVEMCIGESMSPPPHVLDEILRKQCLRFGAKHNVLDSVNVSHFAATIDPKRNWLAQYCLQQRLNQVHGDGRPEREDADESGVQPEFMDHDHMAIFTELSACLKKNQILLMAYGSAHFKLGTACKGIGNFCYISLEEYLMFAPHAQVVVVEEFNLPRSIFASDAFLAHKIRMREDFKNIMFLLSDLHSRFYPCVKLALFKAIQAQTAGDFHIQLDQFRKNAADCTELLIAMKGLYQGRGVEHGILKKYLRFASFIGIEHSVPNPVAEVPPMSAFQNENIQQSVEPAADSDGDRNAVIDNIFSDGDWLNDL